MCWEVRKDAWGVEKCGEGCGRAYGVSGKVCWLVGKGCGERNGGGVEKCVRVWGPNTLPPTLTNISSLTFPYISPYIPHTPTRFPTPPLIPLPTSSLPPPHPNTFPTIPTSLLTFLKCGEVTMWQSHWQLQLLSYAQLLI